MNKFQFMGSEPSEVDVRITNSLGDKFELHGILTDMQVESNGYTTTIYNIAVMPQLKLDKDGKRLTHAARKKRFSETKTIKVIVPSLSAENVGLAAAQAGVEGSVSFTVEPVSGQYVLTFREEYLSE